MSTQAELQFFGTALGVPAELDIRVAGGPLSIRLAPKQGINFSAVWNAISAELQNLLGFGLPSLNGPWAKLIGLSDTLIVTPTLWISPSGGNTSQSSASIQLEFNDPIQIGGTWQEGPFTIELTPNYTVLALVFSYDSAAGGLQIKARVQNETTSVPTSPNDVPGSSPAGTKSQMVTFPFPVPAQQSTPLFQFHYIGIGQRVGPNPVTSADDPMLAIFDQLETQLTGDDPAEILTTLANNFYHPDRDWFIALDVSLRGFRVMLLFNDPAMYGLRISVPMTPVMPWSGFLFEILYQKLSPNLGVYYGALTLPYFMRRIVINGVILILPGFSIWIYTNGDFRVNVGWPLGDNSIGVQVGPLIGAGGFYFAKLRSADNPGVQPTVEYNPILAFGIGLMIYINKSFNASIFSASINVSLSATLQGLLAWEAESGGESSPVTRMPDHYWFAGTASLSILIQGTVDFAIIKASITISFQAFAGLALETGYGTQIAVSASVSVRVSVKVIFFTIHLSFSTSVSETFTITSGTPASVNGPLDPDLQGFIQPSFEQLMREEMLARVSAMIERLAAKPPTASTRMQAAARLALSPQVIDVSFALQPTAVYASGGSGSFAVIASLFIEAPLPGQSPTLSTPFETLMMSVIDWLLTMSNPGLPYSQRFQQIVTLLGQGNEAPLGDWLQWRMAVDTFLSTCTFAISEIDAGSTEPQTAAVLPMLDVLRLTYVDENGDEQAIDFDTFDPVPTGYPSFLNTYFANVGAVSSAASTADAMALSTVFRNSFAAFVLSDYFLLQARSAAGDLLQAAIAYESQQENALLADTMRLWGDADRAWDLADRAVDFVANITGDAELEALLAGFDYASAAGMGSRYLLNGLQLPIPISPIVEPVETAPLNVLTGQQYNVAAGAATASGTLSISPTADPPPGSILFPSGSPDGATCTIPLPSALPPMPSPEWQGASGSPAQPVNGTITVTPLPGVMPGPLYFGTKNQIAWSDAGLPRTILPLPQPLQSLIAANASSPPLQLTVSPTPPPASNNPALSSPPGPPIPSTSALLIRLSIAQVPSNAAASVAGGSPGSPASPAGGAATQYLPYVYQVSGADETTRDLIFAALQGDLTNASISLLYPAPTTSTSPAASPSGSPVLPTGLFSDVMAPNALLAKTNLSTLNQVPGTGVLIAEQFAVAVNLGDDAALLTDVQGFLRLLWEVSVVNAPGFFLFYDTAAGQDLPIGLFSDPGTQGGNASQFNVLVQFAPQPDNTVTLTSATNCVFLEEAGLSQAVYLQVLNSDSTPVLQYAPTYAAGSVGFSLLWNRPPEPSPGDLVPVNDLYQLVQYSVIGGGGYAESVWSLPVGPSENNGPQAALASPNDWTFVQSIAVHNFFGSPEANRYAVIDQPVDLGFRIVDVYGDALPSGVAAPFLPLYQDPLLTVAQWPGVLWSWRIVPSVTPGAASLLLSLVFDPDSVVPPSSSPGGADTSLEQQWLMILARYGLILDQLTDPNTAITLTSTLTNGPMVGNAAIADDLVQVASAIVANIEQGLQLSPPVVEEVTETIELSIPFSAIVALPHDIIAVNFIIGAQRPPALVDPTALAEMPAASAVSYSIPSQIAMSASPGGSPAMQFAIDFESAFQGFDGGSGVLKVAQRAGVQSGDDAPKVDAVWAVRWSTIAGIGIEFDPNQIFYALAPLSTNPLSGTFGGQTWSNVDLDVWARQFLAAYDAFLAPQMAVAIAILDASNGSSNYQALLDTKQALAGTIVLGVQPLFEDQAEGDLTGAQQRLQQVLLSTLSSAYTVSTIVQSPAQVTLTATPSPILSPARAPRLYGTVGPLALSSPVEARQYTLTPGELELIPGANFMTTLLTVTNPSGMASISMPLDYQVSYLQYDFLVEDAYLDYIPSSWLKFALPSAPPLQIPIAVDATLPVPLPFVPQSPTLAGQQAVAAPIPSGGSPGDITGEIENALLWNYQTQIVPNWSAQDVLFFDVTYNMTPTEVLALFAEPTAQLLENLADALATFLLWYQANSGSFGAIIAEAFPGQTVSPAVSPGTASELIAAFAGYAAAVQSAWAALFANGLDVAFVVPQVTIDSFGIATSSESPNQMNLMGHAMDGGNPQYWPMINGQAYEAGTAQPPTSPGEAGWWTQPVPFPRAGALSMEFSNLQIAGRQSATTASWIVRNANLIQGRTTNPDFVFETEQVSYSTSIVPLISRTVLPTLQPAPSLTETLQEILMPIADTGAGLSTTLRVAASFAFAIASIGANGLLTNEAILLADELSVEGSPMVVETVQNLARGIAAWFTAAPQPTEGALLNLALTLFGTLGTQQLPLVQIGQIPIDVSRVPAGWWTT